MHVVCFNFMIRGGTAWGVGRALASEHMSWVAGTDQVEVSGLMLLARDALSFLAGSQHECHVSSYCHSPYAQGCVLERLWLKVDIFFYTHIVIAMHSYCLLLLLSLFLLALVCCPCMLPLCVALACAAYCPPLTFSLSGHPTTSSLTPGSSSLQYSSMATNNCRY